MLLTYLLTVVCTAYMLYVLTGSERPGAGLPDADSLELAAIRDCIMLSGGGGRGRVLSADPLSPMGTDSFLFGVLGGCFFLSFAGLETLLCLDTG